MLITMILIDLGNTSAKIYGNSEVSIPTSEIFEYLEQTTEEVLLCSVVPSYHQEISEKFQNVRIITSEVYPLMFDDSGSQLTTKGADRIIAAYSAVQKYQDKVIVIDIGTCVTFDVVCNRDYISGLIYPGFELLENILFEKIKQLPKPEYHQSMILTQHQIYWANIYGFIGAIKQMLIEIIPDDQYQVILTGGTVLKLQEEHNIDLVAILSDFDVIYDSNLIKHGLIKLASLL